MHVGILLSGPWEMQLSTADKDKLHASRRSHGRDKMLNCTTFLPRAFSFPLLWTLHTASLP